MIPTTIVTIPATTRNHQSCRNVDRAGRLDAVLERLADYTESRHSLRQKISHALIYPIVLTGVALTIVVLMLVYVVPKVIGVFETTGQTLPLLTRALIALSTFFS